MWNYVCESLIVESLTSVASLQNHEKTEPNNNQCDQCSYDENCNHRRFIIPKAPWFRNEWILGHIYVRASIKKTYLEFEIAAADIAVGVDEGDESAEVVEMTLERAYAVDGVDRKVGLLLLVVEKKKREEGLLLCSILVTVVTIDEALQDK